MEVSKAYDHQVVGIEALAKWDDPSTGRIHGGCFALFDEMGLGKTRQVIDSARLLYERDELQTVIVIAPAAVRPVWFDKELGELTKFFRASMRVIEYHTKMQEWYEGTDKHLTWIITNYDFIRRADRLKPLIDMAKQSKTLLVLDESSAVKNFKAEQSKACKELRKECERVILLNGTPIAHSPGDLFMQAFIMDPRILGCKNYYHFRARYAIMGGYQTRQIVGWRDLEDLQAKLKPYILRRLKLDCLDLPPKLPPIIHTVTLTEKSWKIYKELRTEMMAWLDDVTTVSAAQAGVRSLRLAQLTSGFVGGLHIKGQCDCVPKHYGELIVPDENCIKCGGSGFELLETEPKEVGTEKFDAVMALLQTKFAEGEKILVWCRFRFEVARYVKALEGTVPLGIIWGNQKKLERRDALRLFDPRTAPSGPAVIIGTPASGAMGLNLTAGSTCIYSSNDYCLKTRLQSMDRIHRPGQTKPCTYIDVVATGPEGQKTMDHAAVKSLHAKEDLATWTLAAWREALEE